MTTSTADWMRVRRSGIAICTTGLKRVRMVGITVNTAGGSGVIMVRHNGQHSLLEGSEECLAYGSAPPVGNE